MEGITEQIDRRFVGAIRADEVTLHEAAAGAVAAGGDVHVTNGGCGPVAIGGSLTIHNGGCGPVLAGGDASFTNGGCQSVIAGGGATIGERGFAGIVLSPKVVVEDGARVLIDTRAALALGAAGVALAMAIRGRRRG